MVANKYVQRTKEQAAHTHTSRHSFLDFDFRRSALRSLTTAGLVVLNTHFTRDQLTFTFGERSMNL